MLSARSLRPGQLWETGSFWLSRIAIVFLFPPHWSDVVRYFLYAKMLVIEGKVPYRDFPFEYPPLTYLLLLAPAAVERLLNLDGVLQWNTIHTYRYLFALVILPFDRALFRAFRERAYFPGAAGWYVLLTVLCWFFLYDRIDILVGFCLAWPFLKRPGDIEFTARLWGLGAALKVFPLVLAPLLAWKTGKPRALLPALPGIALSCLLALVLSGGTVSFLAWQMGRALQVESLLGGLGMAAKALGRTDVAVVYNFGAYHIVNLPTLTAAAKTLFWLALLGSYGAIWLDRSRRTLLSATWLVASTFVTFGYVLSPQYFLWLIPLGLCGAERLSGRKRATWLLLLCLAAGASSLLFPFYLDFVAASPVLVALLFARNTLLLALWGLGWAWLREKEA